MCQDISRGRDLAPRYAGMALREYVGAYVLDCLPNDFKVARDGIPGFSILKKPFLARLNVLLDPSYTVKDMTQVDGGVFGHSACASPKIRSRK